VTANLTSDVQTRLNNAPSKTIAQASGTMLSTTSW
jgi:hypothetical protein